MLLRQRDITLNFFFHGQFPFLWLVFDFLFIPSVPLETGFSLNNFWFNYAIIEHFKGIKAQVETKTYHQTSKVCVCLLTPHYLPKDYFVVEFFKRAGNWNEMFSSTVIFLVKTLWKTILKCKMCQSNCHFLSCKQTTWFATKCNSMM